MSENAEAAEIVLQPGGGSPDPIDFISTTMKKFTDDLGPYVLGSLGYTLVSIPVTIMGVFLIYFLMFFIMFGGMFGSAIVGVIAGEALGMPELAGLVMLLGYLVTFLIWFLAIFAVFAGLAAVMAPMHASLVRRIAMHQRGEKELDISGAFSHVGQDIGSVIGVTILSSALIFVGFLFFYVPGIILAVMLMYAFTLVAIHRQSPVEACKNSIQHFSANLQFHGLFALVYFGCAMIAGYIPVIGAAFLSCLHIRAHRHLFGDGEEAVMEVA